MKSEFSAKELLEEFWRLEKEAEKMLEELGQELRTDEVAIEKHLI